MPWDVIECEFTNDASSFIVINKNSQFRTGEFNFTLFQNPGSNVILNESVLNITTTIDLDGNYTGSTGPHKFQSGAGFNVTEFANSTQFILSDISCKVYQVNNALEKLDAGSTVDPTDFEVQPWELVECDVINDPVYTVARTQGFWSTHWVLAFEIWDELSNSTKDIYAPFDDNTYILNQTEMMGGFWAKIPRETDNDRRGDLEQAQMQLLQQLLAAILNTKYCNGCSTEVNGVETSIFDLIADAKIAFNSGTKSEVLDYVKYLTNLNEDFHDEPLPRAFEKADPKGAKQNALPEFWDDSVNNIPLPDGPLPGEPGP
jgi:hypothetical protein